MKKFLLRALLFLAAMAGLAAGGYFGARYYFTEYVDKPPEVPKIDPYAVPADIIAAQLYWQPATLDELVGDSEQVVRGYLLDNATQQIIYREGSDDVIQGGFNRSALVVVESYAGSLQPGDKIPYIERYYYTTAPGEGGADEVRLVTYNHYMPTPPGEEFVFFLNRQATDSTLFPGHYFLKNMEKGKYPCLTENKVEGDLAALSNQELNLNLNTPEDYRLSYLALYQEVVGRYIDPLTPEEIAEAEAEAAGETGGFALSPLMMGLAAAGVLAAGAAVFLFLRGRRAKAAAEEAPAAGAAPAAAEAENAPKQSPVAKILALFAPIAGLIGRVGGLFGGLLKRGGRAGDEAEEAPAEMPTDGAAEPASAQGGGAPPPDGPPAPPAADDGYIVPPELAPPELPLPPDSADRAP